MTCSAQLFLLSRAVTLFDINWTLHIITNTSSPLWSMVVALPMLVFTISLFRRTENIIKNPTHPGTSFYQILPSGKCYRSLQTGIAFTLPSSPHWTIDCCLLPLHTHIVFFRVLPLKVKQSGYMLAKHADMFIKPDHHWLYMTVGSQ